MRRLLTLTALAITMVNLTSIGQADDLSGRLYRTSPIPAGYNWSGFYVGGNVGYGIAHDPTSDVFVTPPAAPFLGEAFTLSPLGIIGGAQIGYNWQIGHWLLGAEADGQWSGQHNSACIFLCSIPPTIAAVGYVTQTYSQDISSFGTFRGRFGYAQDGWLLYMTGGAAVARSSTTFTYSSPAVPTASLGYTFNHTTSGWTIGGGMEAALLGNWTAKVEYLYMDFGTVTDVTPALIPGSGLVNTIHLQDHIVRVGLNYRFGGDGLFAVR